MTASSRPASPVSPVDAARDAFDHTRHELFPLRVEKWVLLGVLAFLDQCGRSLPGGGSAGGDGHGARVPGDGAALAALLERATDWLSVHAAAVALASVLGLLVLALVVAAVLWVNARGVFMYLDGVATGRAEVGRSWREHAVAASSYFGWSLAISLAGVFAALLAAGLVVAAAMAHVAGRLRGTGGWLTVAGMLPVLALLLLALPLLGLARVALRDFVAPLQITTGLPCGAAARVLESLVLQHPGAFVLYLLLKLLLVVACGLVIAVGGCFTCCIGFLPVVMQVVFQPLFFFERA
ncbi:MAG TPA: hypothetical protein VLF95_06050, partial [Vicinamibacteria bacterium]|nr:hypothetical protein [Vicinamibacteria bacterium]